MTTSTKTAASVGEGNEADFTSTPIPWKSPEEGVAGAGFFGMKRFVISCASFEYVPGGVDVPISGMNVLTVAAATAKGGVTAYFDKAKNKLQLFRGAAEASGTIEDLVVVFIGY